MSQKVGRDWLDLGGQWIGPTQDRLAALARELQVATFPQHQDGTKILSWGGKIIPIGVISPGSRWPPSSSWP